MKTVLLDSSVWVSFFAKDENYKKAYHLINILLARDFIIMMPTLVYIEIINALHRLKIDRKKIDNAKNILQGNKKIHLCHSTSMFWINEITWLMEKTDLRSHDLIILAHALKYNASLISFDKKLNGAYKKISN